MDILEKDRLARLRNLTTILGEPDLLTVLKVTTVNSFLSHKKTYDKQQKFIFGLNFPTTAHISSYINDKIKTQQKVHKTQSTYKIKLYIYDAFRKIDILTEINIPGSLQIKGFNMNGQPVNVNSGDYQLAYFSSVLRSLYPHFYHQNTYLFGQIEKYEILQSFFQNFIPYAMKNELTVTEQLYQLENVGIQLIINYVKSNQLWNLAHIINVNLQKFFQRRAFLFALQIKQLRQQYKQIIVECAQCLLNQNISMQIAKKLNQFQIRALCKLRKKHQARQLAQGLIRQGLDDLETWQQLLKMYFQGQDDRYFFKVLNTAVSMVGQDSLLRDRLIRAVIPQKIIQAKETDKNIQEKSKKGDSISSYPQYAFKFDYQYIKNQSKLKNLHQLLDKTQKQKSTSDILHRLDGSYQKQSFFQKFVALYQKQKTWNKLLSQRAECFWLQNDYAIYQNSIKKKSSQMSYRFNNQTFYDLQQSSKKGIDSKTKNQEKVMKIDVEDQAQRQQQLNSSFQGQFSDAQSHDEKQIGMVAPCSKRVATKRVFHQRVKKVQFSKILCNYNLQKIFLIAYNNLKLHTDIQKWTQKLNFQTLNQMSKQKKDLIAYVFIKKAFFHKTMLRYRKSQQSFKVARKCSNSLMVGLVSCYCLAKLYLQHNNIKGVEYYTVQIVRILYNLGIQKYEFVPTWAKQIIPYIIKYYGKVIVKRLQGPLKQLVYLWLKIDNKSV